jgi:hypothetical protein
MIATVAVCVALIKLKKYLKPKIVALDSCLGIIPFTEFSRIILLTTKIIKKNDENRDIQPSLKFHSTICCELNYG